MSFANAAMLIGLAGVAIPVVIHLLGRLRAPTVDWGAMQFLRLGPRERARRRLAEWLLLATRMLLLALVALAAARPIWSPGPGEGREGGGPRDVVLVVDGSSGMARRGSDGTAPIDRASRWLSAFVGRLGPGDAVAVVRAGDRPRAALDPPSVDRDRLRAALDGLPPPGGSGDLPAALAEAFRILERSRNPASEVVVLTDGGRHAWHPGDRARWRLTRERHGRLPTLPRIAVATFAVEPDPDSADGAVVNVRPSRRLAAPGATIGVSATVRNAGPAPLERSAELLIDGKPAPGSARAVGPVPPGGSAAVEFRATLRDPGSHAIAVRLAPGGTPDPLAIDDEASAVVEVAGALPVLLVDGDPAPGPMAGAVAFLRAALVPRGDEAPQIRAATIGPGELDANALEGHRVLVLADVDRLTPGQLDAVAGHLGRGGGVLFVPGGRTDAESWNRDAFRDGKGWLPARIGPTRGRFDAREAVARPSPASFVGPALGRLALGEAPPLGSAVLFAYHGLEPADAGPTAEVLGRLDSGDPWLVEWRAGAGRVAMLAGPLDASGGTLPANPDFVPLAHELVFHLAEAAPDASPTPPGAPLLVPIDPPPAPAVVAVPVRAPSGRVVRAAVDRSGEVAVARLDAADEPGLYRFDLPDGPAYRLVASEHPDPAPLSPAEAAAIAEGWPLSFAEGPDAAAPALGGLGRSPRPLWRGLLLAALSGLCLEVWLTRRMARGRGGPAP